MKSIVYVLAQTGNCWQVQSTHATNLKIITYWSSCFIHGSRCLCLCCEWLVDRLSILTREGGGEGGVTGGWGGRAPVLRQSIATSLEMGGGGREGERERLKLRGTYKSNYPYPGSTASHWHVSDLLYNVLGPVVHCLVDLDSCSWLGVKDEPVYTSWGFAVWECIIMWYCT